MRAPPAPSGPSAEECELCEAAHTTDWYYEDDLCWVAECEMCWVPMVVWKRHDPNPPDELRTAIGPGGELARLLPELPALLGDMPEPMAADPDTERHRLHLAVAETLANLGRRQPILLVIEDAHWADRPTLALIRHLARAAWSARLLLLVTYRDESEPGLAGWRYHPLLLDLLRRRTAPTGPDWSVVVSAHHRAVAARQHVGGVEVIVGEGGTGATGRRLNVSFNLRFERAGKSLIRTVPAKLSESMDCALAYEFFVRRDRIDEPLIAEVPIASQDDGMQSPQRPSHVAIGVGDIGRLPQRPDGLARQVIGDGKAEGQSLAAFVEGEVAGNRQVEPGEKA